MTDLDGIVRDVQIELLIKEELGDLCRSVLVVKSVLHPGHLNVIVIPVNGVAASHQIPSLTPTNEQISEAIETLRFKYLFPE